MIQVFGAVDRVFGALRLSDYSTILDACRAGLRREHNAIGRGVGEVQFTLFEFAPIRSLSTKPYATRLYRWWSRCDELVIR